MRRTVIHVTVQLLPDVLADAASVMTRAYLMCSPEFFDVRYRINPWMDPARPVDRRRARSQWNALVDAVRALGHTVEIFDPEPDLPDMVFAANAGFVLGGRVLGAHFRHSQRRPEEAPYRRWLERHGFTVYPATEFSEGEGDFALARGMLLAGWGFRSTPAAHREAQEFFGCPVVSLELVDPRYYHLDTALAVVDDRTVAYYPAAFSPGSRAVIKRLFGDIIEVSAADAAVLGLNALSDGHHVILPAQATTLASELAERGFVPLAVDVSEFRKAGGGPKCMMLELRS
jgi:N-dimethylarginine dimethylaminohydrolase